MTANRHCKGCGSVVEDDGATHFDGPPPDEPAPPPAPGSGAPDATPGAAPATNAPAETPRPRHTMLDYLAE
jgi:hypothetical protein